MLSQTQIMSLLNGKPKSDAPKVKFGKFEGKSAPMVRTRKGSKRGNGGSRQYVTTPSEWEYMFSNLYQGYGSLH